MYTTKPLFDFFMLVHTCNLDYLIHYFWQDAQQRTEHNGKSCALGYKMTDSITCACQHNVHLKNINPEIFIGILTGVYLSSCFPTKINPFLEDDVIIRNWIFS